MSSSWTSLAPWLPEVDVAPILALPLRNATIDTFFTVDIHNEIEARARIGVGGGMHLQAVFGFPFVGDDMVQTAMEPYFVYEPIRGFYARAGLVVAIDEDLGFGFYEGKVASIRIALGGKW